ncbi:hypothetical protein BV22DRAFT_983558, partial [Leucogyrophana mollusca]
MLVIGSSQKELKTLNSYAAALEDECESEVALMQKRVRRCRLEHSLFKGGLCISKERLEHVRQGHADVIRFSDDRGLEV